MLMLMTDAMSNSLMPAGHMFSDRLADLTQLYVTRANDAYTVAARSVRNSG